MNKQKPTSIAIFPKKIEYLEKAREISKKLNLEIICDNYKLDKFNLIILIDENGLSLKGDGLTLHGDFTSMIPRLKPNNLNGEMLVKAAKIKSLGMSPTAVDATAGLGEDSFLLAAVGFKVILYEYNPIIEILLDDALSRASKNPILSEIVTRMKLFNENSINALPKLTFSPDLILLDPMFPSRQKSSLVKKKFQILKHLEQPCENEDELIKSAIMVKPKKIIIKRPTKGPFLGGIKPSYSIEGKSIRYDCLCP